MCRVLLYICGNFLLHNWRGKTDQSINMFLGRTNNLPLSRSSTSFNEQNETKNRDETLMLHTSCNNEPLIVCDIYNWCCQWEASEIMFVIFYLFGSVSKLPKYLQTFGVSISKSPRSDKQVCMNSSLITFPSSFLSILTKMVLALSHALSCCSTSSLVRSIMV